MSAHHTLRPYQQSAVNQIRKLYSQGTKKVLLHLATGGGKTTVFSHIMGSSAEKGKKIVMVVRGRKLVDQAHKRLLAQGVPHGVLMSNHWNVNSLAPVQLCSIDTLRARELYPPADLVVYDEAHFCISKSYLEFVTHYPDAFHLPVTATPYVDKSLRHIADAVVKPTSMKELIEEGFLVPPVYYAPTDVADVSKARISRSTKDYVTADLENILNTSDIVGNLVGNWIEFAQQRSTLVFAVSIEHSKHIAKMFNDAGIPAAHCDADTKDSERDIIIKQLEYGELKVVSNVGIFCTGVDIPTLGCIQMARPTQSYNLFIQQAGRGTRPAPGKEDFILLDNAGNTLKHGFIVDEPECNLDGMKSKSNSGIKIKRCPGCLALISQFEQECPHCGFEYKNKESVEREVNEIDGTLVKLEDMPLEARAFQRFTALKKERKLKQYKKGWIYYRMEEEFGEEIAQKYCPKREVPKWLMR